MGGGLVLRLAPSDDVAVALRELAVGTSIVLDGCSVVVRERIPRGHKVAVRGISAGSPVHKYGWVIGQATVDIAAGSHVHVHNLAAGELGERIASAVQRAVPPPRLEAATFDGYRRTGRRAGTRNHVAVVATVNCAADVAHAVVRHVRAQAIHALANVDSVFPITHQSGCGMPLGGASYDVLVRCLRGIATHPNVAGVLIVGLGCEVVQPAVIAEAAQALGVPHRVITIQETGGTGRTIRAGIEAVGALLERANECRREPVPISELVVGAECGGSDAYSGITANPLLGRAGDILVQAGASWVLSESPETYGAEHLLTARARSEEVAERLVAVMRRWERYTALHGATVDNNPAPGNKEGGITTVYEKALGAVAKAGSSPLVDVLEYAAPVVAQGLSFMDTPGMDDVSVTGLAAGGCTLIGFTTGRGSALAFAPVPIVKIASTTELFEAMPDDMDFDAGVVLGGEALDNAALRLARLIVATASGRPTCGERQGLGDYSFAPWDLGPTL